MEARDSQHLLWSLLAILALPAPSRTAQRALFPLQSTGCTISEASATAGASRETWAGSPDAACSHVRHGCCRQPPLLPACCCLPALAALPALCPGVLCRAPAAAVRMLRMGCIAERSLGGSCTYLCTWPPFTPVRRPVPRALLPADQLLLDPYNPSLRYFPAGPATEACPLPLPIITLPDGTSWAAVSSLEGLAAQLAAQGQQLDPGAQSQQQQQQQYDGSRPSHSLEELRMLELDVRTFAQGGCGGRGGGWAQAGAEGLECWG